MGNQNKYKSGSIFDMQFITSSISTTLVLLLLGLVVFFCIDSAQSFRICPREYQFLRSYQRRHEGSGYTETSEEAESGTFRETIRIYL